MAGQDAVNARYSGAQSRQTGVRVSAPLQCTTGRTIEGGKFYAQMPMGSHLFGTDGITLGVCNQPHLALKYPMNLYPETHTADVPEPATFNHRVLKHTNVLFPCEIKGHDTAFHDFSRGADTPELKDMCASFKHTAVQTS